MSFSFLNTNNGRPSVLSYAGFRNLWMGQLVSSFGDVLHFLVFYWWAAELGGPVGMSIVMSCSIGTYVALSMYAGTIADRVDRRKLMFWSDVACSAVAASMVAIAWLNPRPQIWVLCVLAIILKTAYVFQIPARNASVPRLVPEDRLVEANSLNIAAQTGMPLAGNAIGAVVLGVVFKLSASLAYVVAFTINSLTFIFSSFFMARLPAIEPERTTEPKHPFQEAKDGIRVIWQHKVLRTALFLFFAFEFFLAPFMPAYIVAAQTTFKSGFDLFGLTIKGPALLSLLETGFFLGFVLGSLIVYRRPIFKVGKAYILFITLGALAMAPMGFASTVGAFWVLNFSCGLLFPFAIIPMQSYMQTAAPDEYRGRVSSGIGTVAATAAPLGALSSGVLLSLWGLPGTFAFIGIGLATAATIGWASPAFRNAEMPKPKEPVEVAEVEELQLETVAAS